MPLDIPIQSNQGGDSGAADAFKPLTDALDTVAKYLSDETPLFKRQNQLLQQLNQLQQRQVRMQQQAGKGATGGTGAGISKQTEAIKKNINMQDNGSASLKVFESFITLTTSPLARFAKTSGLASAANIASIASTGKAALSTNALNDAFTQTIKPLEELRRSFATAGAGSKSIFGGGASDVEPPTGSKAFGESTEVDTKELQEQIDKLKEKIKETDAVFGPLEKQYNDLKTSTREATAAFVSLGDGFGRVSIEEFQKRLQEASAKINEAAGEASVKLASGLNMDEAETAIAEFAHTMASTDLNDSLTSAHKKILDLDAEVNSLTMAMNASAAATGSAAADTTAALTQVAEAAVTAAASLEEAAPAASKSSGTTEPAGGEADFDKRNQPEPKKNTAQSDLYKVAKIMTLTTAGGMIGSLVGRMMGFFEPIEQVIGGAAAAAALQIMLLKVAKDGYSALGNVLGLDAAVGERPDDDDADEDWKEIERLMKAMGDKTKQSTKPTTPSDFSAEDFAADLKAALKNASPAITAAAPIAAGGTATGDPLKEFAKQLSADFKLLHGSTKDLIKATYAKTKEASKSGGSTLSNLVKKIGGAAASPVETMKSGLGMGRNVVGMGLKGAYGGIKSAAPAALKGAGAALKTGVAMGFGTALKTATGALGSLTKLVGAAGGPIGMLATTIASAVIGNIVSFGMELTYAADMMGSLGTITSGLGTYFGKMVNGALAPFAAAMQRSANAVERNSQAAELSGLAMRRQAELAKTAGSIQKQTSDSVMNAVKNPLVGLPEIIKQMSSYVAIVDPAAAEQADLALKGFAGVIGQILRPALNILVGGLNLITGQLMSEKGFKGLSAAVATVATLIVERIKGIDFEKFVDELLKGAVSLIEALTTVGTVMTDLAWAFNGIVQVCSWLWDGLTALGQGIWYIVSTIFVAFIDGMKMITNIFIWVANSITSIITSIVNYVKSWVGGKKSEAPQMSYLTPSYEQDKMASKGPEKNQAPAFDTKTNVVGQAGFKGLGDVGKEMQQRSFKSGMTLEKAQLDMAIMVANLLKNPSSSALFEALKNMGGGFVAPNANAQGA